MLLSVPNHLECVDIYVHNGHQEDNTLSKARDKGEKIQSNEEIGVKKDERLGQQNNKPIELGKNKSKTEISTYIGQCCQLIPYELRLELHRTKLL